MAGMQQPIRRSFKTKDETYNLFFKKALWATTHHI
jgi:hypothetical protein